MARFASPIAKFFKEKTMPSRIALSLIALTLIAVLAIPTRVAAQGHHAAPYPYLAIDLGTFGGPNANFDTPGQPLTNQGTVLGIADTSLPDPNYAQRNPYFGLQDSYVSHLFAWHKGVLTDLGALPGMNVSGAYVVNAHGEAAGQSENGVIDPRLGYTEVTAVVWQNRHILKLGTLGGTESLANGINDRGQVVGCAANATADPWTLPGLSLVNWGTQTRAFLWQHGVMRDLGTLGGPDACAVFVNERGQIDGLAFTNATPNPMTGQPTTAPFLWDNGRMHNLGTLGGANGYPNDLNNRGEVVGQSNLKGDRAYHPFLWDGTAMKDLGTLGGTDGYASWINEAGDVVGRADEPGSLVHHAFLWRKGRMTDLGTPAGSPCSTAHSVNARDQVVGDAGECGVGGHAWLWEKGAIIALDKLVAPTGLSLTDAQSINDRGEIACLGQLPNGDVHVVLLVPTRRAQS
jgi:probable HAF family extracellular repeat protein